MNENRKIEIVAFTGHRTYSGGMDGELRKVITELYSRGARIFRVGMAEGFDLSAGEIVTEIKGSYPDIIIEAYIPYPDFSAHFNTIDRSRYNHILTNAAIIRYAAEGYSAGVYHRRNDMLIEGADVVVAWLNNKSSGTGYTVRRARKQQAEVINLCERELFVNTI